MFSWLRSLLGLPDPGEVAALREELAAKAAAPDLFPGKGDKSFGLITGTADLGRDHERYQHNRGWVFSCIRAIANRIADQPIRVGRKQRRVRGNGQVKAFAPDLDRAPQWVRQKAAAGGIDVLDQHPLLDALSDPNDLMTAWSLMFTIVTSLELTGKAYLWATEDDAGKLRLWPIPSSWVQPLHEHGLYDSYKVKPPTLAGEGFTLPGSDVLRFCYPDPQDPLGAVSPLARLGQAVTTDETIQGAQEAAFRNGINPSWILTVGKDAQIPGMTGASPRMTLSQNQRQQITQYIRQHYRGFHRNQEPLILDSLIENAIKASNTPAEMDFLNSAGLTKERICQGFNVNPIILGDILNSNRASALAASDQFNEFCVNPKISLISQVMTGWFSARYRDPSLLVWLEPAVSLDPELELKKVTALADRGGATVNELRHALMGWAPLADGDRLALPPAKPGSPAKASKPSKLIVPDGPPAPAGRNGRH